MKDIEDKVSLFLKRALDILFVKNPQGTSLGIISGIILDGLLTVFSPFYEIFKLIINSGINILHYICLGIFSFNIRKYFSKDEIDPQIKIMLEFIEKQKSDGLLTAREAKEANMKLITSLIESVRFDPKNNNEQIKE